MIYLFYKIINAHLISKWLVVVYHDNFDDDDDDDELAFISFCKEVIF